MGVKGQFNENVLFFCYIQAFPMFTFPRQWHPHIDLKKPYQEGLQIDELLSLGLKTTTSRRVGNFFYGIFIHVYEQ